MKAYDKKCAGCRWAGQKRLFEGHQPAQICLEPVGTGFGEQQAWMREIGPCGPGAKLFEAKETR